MNTFLPIPDMNAACVVNEPPADNPGGFPEAPDYVAKKAIYAIGRLRTALASYNTCETTIDAYGITPEDLNKVWQPTIYTISDGQVTAVTSGGITSAGTASAEQLASSGCKCEPQGYSINDGDHVIVSWLRAAKLAITEGAVT